MTVKYIKNGLRDYMTTTPIRLRNPEHGQPRSCDKLVSWAFLEFKMAGKETLVQDYQSTLRIVEYFVA